MKQIYKAEGPYKSACGKSYDVKNISSSERPPKGWSIDLEKVLGKVQKQQSKPELHPEPVIDTVSLG